MRNFTLVKTVVKEDLDAVKHVNNVRYVQWIQEISEAHWKVLAKPEWLEKYLWVVRHHSIEYKGAAYLGDKVILSTNISANRGAISTRQVEMRLGSSAKPIVKATTSWCLLEALSLKPVRIPAAMLQLLNEQVL